MKILTPVSSPTFFTQGVVKAFVATDALSFHKFTNFTKSYVSLVLNSKAL